MSAAFTVDVCRRCGHAVYPPRILCPRCAGAEWHRRLADAGVVEEVTVRRPVSKHRQLPWGNWVDQTATRLASVRTDAGPLVVARVGEDVQPGDRVSLETQASTAIAVTGRDVEALPKEPAGRTGDRGEGTMPFGAGSAPPSPADGSGLDATTRRD